MLVINTVIVDREVMQIITLHLNFCMYHRVGRLYIIELVDSISRDERDSPLTQYITNAGISRDRYTIMLFKHNHRVLRLISNRITSLYSASLRTHHAK